MDLFITRRGGPGGGGGLSFVVECGAAQPASPAENTVWVVTDVPAGAWTVSFNAPDPAQEGDVFLELSPSSFSVDLSGDGAVTVEIANVLQAVSGAWVQREAWIYRNGAWEEAALGERVLLDEAGWRSGLSFRTVTDHADITINNAAYPVTLFMYRYSGAYIPDINFTDYDTLEFDLELANNDKALLAVSDTTTYNTSASSELAALRRDGAIPRGYYSLDVSAITGKHHIKISAWGVSGTMNIYSIRLIRNGA